MPRAISVMHSSVYGGPHNEFAKLRRPLADRGWDMVAILPTEPGEAGRRLREDGAEVIEMPLERMRASLDPRLHARYAIDFPAQVRRIRAVIQETRADLVQCHGPVN